MSAVIVFVCILVFLENLSKLVYVNKSTHITNELCVEIYKS